MLQSNSVVSAMTAGSSPPRGSPVQEGPDFLAFLNAEGDPETALKSGADGLEIPKDLTAKDLSPEGRDRHEIAVGNELPVGLQVQGLGVTAQGAKSELTTAKPTSSSISASSETEFSDAGQVDRPGTNQAAGGNILPTVRREIAGPGSPGFASATATLNPDPGKAGHPELKDPSLDGAQRDQRLHPASAVAAKGVPRVIVGKNETQEADAKSSAASPKGDEAAATLTGPGGNAASSTRLKAQAAVPVPKTAITLPQDGDAILRVDTSKAGETEAASSHRPVMAAAGAGPLAEGRAPGREGRGSSESKTGQILADELGEAGGAEKPSVLAAKRSNHQSALSDPSQSEVARTGSLETSANPPAADAKGQSVSAPAHSASASLARIAGEVPQGFDDLVERLAGAREGSSPHAVKAAVRNADFGMINMQFRADDARLNVTLANADPEFAPAVQAAGSAAMAGQSSNHNGSSSESNTHGQSRQDGQSAGQTSTGAGQSSDSGKSRSRPETRDGTGGPEASETQLSGHRHEDKSASSERRIEQGIFA